MQPTSGSPQYPPPPGYGSAPGEAVGRPQFVTPPPQVSVTRVRAGAVGLTAGLAMLVLLAAVGNQKVTDTILRHEVTFDRAKFWDNVLVSFTSISWRFSPRGNNDIGHVWIAGVAFVIATILLTGLVTAGLARGKRGFGGSFLAAWVGGFFASQVSTYLRASIADISQLTGQEQSKPAAIFFSQYSPGLYGAFVGLLFGAVAALVAAAVGAWTARTNYFVEPDAALVPADGTDLGGPPVPVRAGERQTEERPVWTAPPAPAAAQSPWTAPERSDRADRPDLGKTDDAPQHTAVLPVIDQPVVEEPVAEEQVRADHDAQATTQFPAWPPRAEARTEYSSGPTVPEPAAPESEPTQAYRVPEQPPAVDEPEATQAYRLPREDEDPPRQQP